MEKHTKWRNLTEDQKKDAKALRDIKKTIMENKRDYDIKRN